MDPGAQKKVLVAVDESARADEVVREGVELARAFDAKVFLVRAIGVRNDLPIEAYAMSPDAIADTLRERALSDLRGRATKHGIDIGSLIVEMGTAWEVIVRVAREKDVDFVVLGAHNYGGLDRVLGTTAARVVNHADRSVLVVRSAPDPNAAPKVS